MILKRKALSLFKNRFKFSNCLKIFWPTRGTLDLNQQIEIETQTIDTVKLDSHSMRHQIGKKTSASHFSKQIQGTERRGQREVEAAFDRLGLPIKRKSRRCAAKIGSSGLSTRTSREMLSSVRLCTTFQVVRDARRAMGGRSDTSNKDELHAAIREDA